MVDLIYASLFGMIAGMLIGLLPGLGTTAFLILCFPFLITQSFIFSILFYCTASSISQYFGSVTTLTLGIPGENTSLPLLNIRAKIIAHNKLNEVYYLSAFGSLVASILSGVLIYFCLDFFSTTIFYLKSYFSLIFALLGFLLCILYSDNKVLISAVLMISGWCLGKIGYNEITNDSFLTFDNPYLYSGIPTLPAIMGLYALPNLLLMFKKLKSKSTSLELKLEKVNVITVSIAHAGTILRSSLTGFVSGLIPYIGNGISSNLAFNIERKINPHNFVAHAAASEAANNSANLSVLIPLLLLGVAIVPSEYVLLEIISSGNKFINWASLSDSFLSIVFCLAVTNFLAFGISWNGIKIFNRVVARIFNVVAVPLMIFVMVSIFLIGMEVNQGLFYLLTLLMFCITGLCMQRFDLLPLVYAFLLQNNVEQIFYRFYQIYLA